MKQLLVMFMLLCSTVVFAQDVIVKKDGSTILAKVLEVNTDNIKFKKHSNLNGPTYTIEKSEIISINYENGEKDNFSLNDVYSVQDKSNSSQRYIKKIPDAKNTEIIARYNKYYTSTKHLQKSRKEVKGYMLVFGIKSSSTLSNEDIEVSFVRSVSNIGIAYQHVKYDIIILNKTNKTIYIDKGNCFKIWNNGTSYCYYEPTEQTTVNTGGGSGVSLGLGSVAGALGIGGAIGQLAGGISVGGGKSHSVSTTYTQQRVIAIPPHGKKNLTEEKSVLTKDAALYTKLLMVGQSESFNFTELKSSEIKASDDYIDFGGPYETDFILQRNIAKMGEVVTYDESNSPYSRKYILTYSTDENFSTYSTVEGDFYLREIIGCEKLYKKNMYGERTILSDKYIEGIDQFTIEGYYDIE